MSCAPTIGPCLNRRSHFVMAEMHLVLAEIHCPHFSYGDHLVDTGLRWLAQIKVGSQSIWCAIVGGMRSPMVQIHLDRRIRSRADPADDDASAFIVMGLVTGQTVLVSDTNTPHRGAAPTGTTARRAVHAGRDCRGGTIGMMTLPGCGCLRQPNNRRGRTCWDALKIMQLVKTW